MAQNEVLRGIADAGVVHSQPGLAEGVGTKAVATIRGVLVTAGLNGEHTNKLWLELRTDGGKVVRAYCRPCRTGVETFVLLKRGDLMEVNGYPRASGGIQVEGLSWLNLTDREMDDRRFESAPRLRELLWQ
jgi:hypothetical protein